MRRVVALLSLLTLAEFLAPGRALAAATYSVSSASYAWISTAGHAALGPASWDSTLGCVDSVGDDSLSVPISIGFPFSFGPSTYTQLRIYSNGRIQFANTRCTYGTQSVGPPRTYSDPMPNANIDRSITAFGADLDNSAAGGGTIYYATIGSAPNRTFVVTYQGVPQWSANGTTYQLQIQLEEAGDFYLMYGNSVDTVNGRPVGAAQVGYELTTSDFVVASTGLPAGNSGLHFTPIGTASAFKISYANYGLYCLDQTVRITPVNSSGNPVAGYGGTVHLSTTSGHGTWLLSSGSGALSDPVPDDGAADYQWNPAESTATFLLRYRAGSAVVTANAVDSAVATIRDDGTQRTITFSPSGFTVTSSPFSNPAAGVPAFASPQVAGNNFSLYLTAYGQNPTDATCGIITGYAGGKSLKFWSTYVDPASGTIAATINGTSVATAEASASAQAVTFTSGQATVTARYKDAGSLSLSMKDDTTGNPQLSNGIRGTTGTFVSEPANFTVSNIKRTSDAFANPAASTASGTMFIAAGQPFTATVTAVESGGATTPNFGRESSPESVKFTATLVLPAAGNAPAVSGTAGAFSSGVATGTAFAWPEVGIVRLVPHIADGSYLGAGDVTGTASGNVGRFIPNGFGVALNTPIFGTACSAGSFTYVGQPFTYTVAPVITVTAQALGGATTQNYTGTLMRLTNSSLTGRRYTPTPASPALTLTGLPASSADPAIADLGSGQASLTFGAGSGLSFTRGTAIAPFTANIALSINVIDADNVVAANPVTFGAGTGIAFSTGAAQRYGRLALKDAVGSELLDLPLALTTQYYASAAQGFITNTSDSCSAAPAIAFSGYQLNLSSGETCVRDSGRPGSSGVGCVAAAAPGLAYRATAASGDFNLILAAPGAGNNGAVTLTPSAPAWLQYLWNAASGTNSNPSGMATFGVFPGPSSRVYQREIY